MLGDVLLINDRHRRAAEVILTGLEGIRKKKIAIAISGESGSGKSELAHVLARRIKEGGLRGKVIHTDNFYTTLPAGRNEIRRQLGIARTVGPQEYDWDALNHVIVAFKTGNVVSMPCVDLLTDQVDTQITDMSDIDYLILDGLYAIRAKGMDVRIFIDIPYQMTAKAQLLRGKETNDPTRAEVLEAEHRAVTELKKRATLIIDADFQVYQNISE